MLLYMLYFVEIPRLERRLSEPKSLVLTITPYLNLFIYK